MKTTCPGPNFLEIIKQNHEGVALIHEARYKDAIRHLSRGLTQCRSMTFLQTSEENSPGTKSAKPSKTLDQYMNSSYEEGPQESHKRNIARDEVVTEEEVGTYDYRDPIDVDHAHSSCPSGQVLFDDVSILAAIITFNLALAHQLDPASNISKLRRALSLYQLGLTMADVVDSGTPRTEPISSTSFRAACLCNMGVISRIIRDYNSSSTYFEGFLRLVIFMTVTRHPNTSRLNDRHPRLLLSLLFPGACDSAAPAA